MPHGDNLILHRQVERYMRSLAIPPGILGDRVLRLIEDGFMLRLLAHDPVAISFRRERLERLVDRKDIYAGGPKPC